MVRALVRARAALTTNHWGAHAVEKARISIWAKARWTLGQPRRAFALRRLCSAPGRPTVARHLIRRAPTKVGIGFADRVLARPTVYSHDLVHGTGSTNNGAEAGSSGASCAAIRLGLRRIARRVVAAWCGRIVTCAIANCRAVTVQALDITQLAGTVGVREAAITRFAAITVATTVNARLPPVLNAIVACRPRRAAKAVLRTQHFAVVRKQAEVSIRARFVACPTNQLPAIATAANASDRREPGWAYAWSAVAATVNHVLSSVPDAIIASWSKTLSRVMVDVIAHAISVVIVVNVVVAAST